MASVRLLRASRVLWNAESTSAGEGAAGAAHPDAKGKPPQALVFAISTSLICAAYQLYGWSLRTRGVLNVDDMQPSLLDLDTARKEGHPSLSLASTVASQDAVDAAVAERGMYFNIFNWGMRHSPFSRVHRSGTEDASIAAAAAAAVRSERFASSLSDVSSEAKGHRHIRPSSSSRRYVAALDSAAVAGVDAEMNRAIVKHNERVMQRTAQQGWRAKLLGLNGAYGRRLDSLISPVSGPPPQFGSHVRRSLGLTATIRAFSYCDPLTLHSF
eukprot:TRINITY_DN10800_c0_g1_i1.p1 TRINITY_DN10800_c0_g1~~TRINITY_DN10800_c0_g1_i1.p1  ORF type:complete len:271 (+),score=52.53 TRINITY_DN10800_c0_g1_i1:471-1283(+)